MIGQPHKQHPQSVFYILLLSVVLLALGYFIYLVFDSYNTLTDADIIAELTEQESLGFSADSRSDGTSVEGVQIESTDDPFFGSQDASVRIVEFGDFECPYCQDVHRTVKQLEQRYADKIFFQFRDFPVVLSHPNALDAAVAAECAHEQGTEAFWAYHDRLFQFQDSFSDELYSSLAERNGLDVLDFDRCYENRLTENEINDDYFAGLDAGVPGTPTFFINGVRVPGVISADTFFSIIDRLLEESET